MPVSRLLRALAVALLALAPRLTVAQGAPPPACRAPAHRQFDFWLGAWDVRTPSDQPAGTSRITSILGGCVIHEEWHGTGGSDGESFNIYNPSTRRWHQTWVDNSGLLAQFDGALTPQGAMLLEGPGRIPTGAPARSRMTFTPLPDGAVRQVWEFSTDSGKTWSQAFDGIYRRRKED